MGPGNPTTRYDATHKTLQRSRRHERLLLPGDGNAARREKPGTFEGENIGTQLAWRATSGPSCFSAYARGVRRAIAALVVIAACGDDGAATIDAPPIDAPHDGAYTCSGT